MKISNNKFVFILSVLLIVSVVFNIMTYKNKGEINKEREKELKIENDKLRKQNDSIEDVILSIKMERKLLISELDSLKTESERIDEEANKIIERKNEAIRLVNNMDSDELIKLFSEFEFTPRQDTSR